MSNVYPKHSIATLVVAFLLLLLADTAGAAEKKYYKKTLETYQVPEVTLINQDGEQVHLRTLLDGEEPIVLDFIYGTCTTICPVLSVGFSHFQRKTTRNGDKVRLVSISIDPDNDTPELMKAYRQKYDGQPGWELLTGKREHVTLVLKEFDAYVANKMDHYPLTLLRAPGDEKWVRLYGLLSASDLMKEYKQLRRE